MTGYVAEYETGDHANIFLPVITVKRYGDAGPVACVLGHLGQVHRADALCAYGGRPVKFLRIRPA